MIVWLAVLVDTDSYVAQLQSLLRFVSRRKEGDAKFCFEPSRTSERGGMKTSRYSFES